MTKDINVIPVNDKINFNKKGIKKPMKMKKLWKPLIIGSLLIASLPISNTAAFASEISKDENVIKHASFEASNMTIMNKVNIDTITLMNLTIGNTYTIYKDSMLKNKLTSFTAVNSSEILSFSQLGENGGSLYVVVSSPEYKDSDPTKITFLSEKLSPLAAENIKISNNIDNDKIALKNLTKGYTYTIYKDANLKNSLSAFTATNSSETLTFKQLGEKGGEIYVVVSHPDYQTSNKTPVTFKAQTTPALSPENVKVTNHLKKSDTVTLTGLTKGYKYTIFKDAKKKTKLSSFTAKNASKTLTVKQLGTTSGKLYITAKATGYSTSDTTIVSYAKEPFIKMKLLTQIKPVPSSAILKKTDAYKYSYNSWTPPKYHEDAVEYSYQKKLSGGGKIKSVIVYKKGDRSVTSHKKNTITIWIEAIDKKGEAFSVFKENHDSSPNKIYVSTMWQNPKLGNDGFLGLIEVANKFLESFK